MKREKHDFEIHLRRKFIETAKQFIGVPYAKRYLDKDQENYYSPIFLDCCGLVRRVMHDLRESFGFSLGFGNQNYLFDTCPMQLTFEQLQPGDLIFYQATYHKRKKHITQKH